MEKNQGFQMAPVLFLYMAGKVYGFQKTDFLQKFWRSIEPFTDISDIWLFFKSYSAWTDVYAHQFLFESMIKS